MPLNDIDYRQNIAQYRGPDLIAEFPDRLLDLWLDDYLRTHLQAELVTVTVNAEGSSFTYLFDIARERMVGVVGLPTFVKHKRDAGRMAGHPLSQGPAYHRGHLIAHSIGGGADINLVPQLGSLNIGQFRIIERLVRKLAQENVYCLYFVRTIYPKDSSSGKPTQLPSFIEQGVVHQPGYLTYALHKNT
jgi:hypothetical protein